MSQQAGFGDISVPINTSSAAEGGKVWSDSSGWVVNFSPKGDTLTGTIAAVPWYVWAAVAAAALILVKKKRS